MPSDLAGQIFTKLSIFSC